MGRKKTDEYNKAYDLYCNTDLDQKQIASIVKVSAAQLGKWVKENDWELDRTAKQVTVEKLIRSYYKEMAEMQAAAARDKRRLTPAETDQIVKYTNSIEKLRKKNNLSAYHAILRECLEYMMNANPANAKLFAADILEFLKYKAQQLSNDKSIG